MHKKNSFRLLGAGIAVATFFAIYGLVALENSLGSASPLLLRVLFHALRLAALFLGLYLALVTYFHGYEDEPLSEESKSFSSALQPGESDMMDELMTLMASPEYAAMSEGEQRNAHQAVRQKHGFGENG